MSLDYQQVRQQIKKLGETAPLRARQLRDLRLLAQDLLMENANNQRALRELVELAARQYDPTLRCALPPAESLGRAEALNGSFPLPPMPQAATILAADGSQITPDRHAEILYGLINVGAIWMRLGSPDPPQTFINSRLIYDEQLDSRAGGALSEAELALQRDLSERLTLLSLAREAAPPIITFTDGPMELWGAKDAAEAAEFQKSLAAYVEVLEALHGLGVITAGYVDRPSAGLVVRLLEVASLPPERLPRLKDAQTLRRVNDIHLFRDLLEPGARSAVFAIQSKSATNYAGPLALHFFYLNVGRVGRPYLARVEIPAWVAGDSAMLDNLHAALVSQCRLMGPRPYPYLLQRAHETAVVSLDEKEQVTSMIVLELRSRGIDVDEISYKQSGKNLQKRTRYTQ